MILRELFPRRARLNQNRINGPYGFIETKNNVITGIVSKLWVVVNVTSTRIQRRTERLLANHNYTLTNDGEYSFDLNLSDTSNALAIIGLRSNCNG